MTATADTLDQTSLDQTSLDQATLNPVAFGETFVGSEAFKVMFREGMALVEETAAYLDGDGREVSKALPRDAALAYATESMRLTTRLMSLASWLLLQRAVGEGELTREQAERDKTRIRLPDSGPTRAGDAFAALPEDLQGLVRRSRRLQERVIHLDAQVAGRASAPRGTGPVGLQIDLLRSAFAGR